MKRISIILCIFAFLLLTGCVEKTQAIDPKELTVAATASAPEPAKTPIETAFRTKSWEAFFSRAGVFISASQGSKDIEYVLSGDAALVDFTHEGTRYEFKTSASGKDAAPPGTFEEKAEGPESDGPYFAGSISVLYNKGADCAALFQVQDRSYCLYAKKCSPKAMSKLIYALASETGQLVNAFLKDNMLCVSSGVNSIMVPAHWIYSGGGQSPCGDGMRLQTKDVLELIDTIPYSKNLSLSVGNRQVDINGDRAAGEVKAVYNLYDAKQADTPYAKPLVFNEPCLTILPRKIQGDAVVSAEVIFEEGEYYEGYQYLFRVSDIKQP